MRVIVLGAGIIGITTAYFLASSGYEVVVLDRQDEVGLETSFANGGQVSASHAEPWATTHTFIKIAQWLGQSDAPLAFHLAHWDPYLWAWIVRFIRNCTSIRAKRNIMRILRLALYSRMQLKILKNRTGISYKQRTHGILHIYRTPKVFHRACSTADMMRIHGLEYQICSASTCLALEPALLHASPYLIGGLYNADDESGDAYLFTTQLAQIAKNLGVDFRFGVTVQGLETRSGHIVHVMTDHGPVSGTCYILAFGSYSPQIARTINLHLPIYPAKGYSITVDTTGFMGTPKISITDDEHAMVYSRLGNHLRVAGTAELTGWNQALTPIRTEILLKKSHALFPYGGDYSNAVLWSGLRPKTPDSVPIIGYTPWPELFLNTGHGTLGWTMAIGSAHIMTDLISGRTPNILLDGLGLERFL